MLTALLTATLLAAPAGDIDWTETYGGAVARSEAEGKVLFVAVHMPGERANERMAKSVYPDKTIKKLAEQTVNVVAMSMDAYEDRGTRLDLDGLTVDQLRKLDIDIRREVLKPDALGFVVAPQHVFLAPDGTVLLSVPYEVTVHELEWCFVHALAKVDPEHAPKASSAARPPKRLIQAGVIEGSDEQIGAAPATLEEVRELIKEINKSREGRFEKMMRMLTADEEEAREFITKHLRGGGKRGDENKAGMILNIQRRSPASWWEVVTEFAEHQSEDVREEVAACLEVLASPDAARDLKKIVSKEQDPRLLGMWLRAQASSAGDESSVQKAIVKQALKGRETITRANAALALGYLAPVDASYETLVELLSGEHPESVKLAAICATAINKDERHRERLTLLAAEEGPLKTVAEAALITLEGGDLTPLGPHVKQACGDKVNRERLFGVVR